MHFIYRQRVQYTIYILDPYNNIIFKELHCTKKKFKHTLRKSPTGFNVLKLLNNQLIINVAERISLCINS